MSNPIRASQVKPVPVEWLWMDRIPRGMITIVGGRPDQGKGLFMAYLASVISRTRFQQKNGRKRWGRVLYSAIEDSHAMMTRPRLEAAGCRLAGVDLWRFQLPAMWDDLVKRLTTYQYDLLVIDPFASHLSHGISRHSDNVRKVIDPLNALLDQTGTACVIAEHVLKRVPQSGHPLAAIGGSGSGLLAATRMAFLLGIDPKDADRRMLCCVKHNIREKPKEIAFEVDVCDVPPVGEVPALMYDDEVNFNPMLMLNIKPDAKIGRPPDKRAAAAEWLTNYLYAAKQEVPSGKVFEDAKHFGIPQRTLRKAAKELKVLRNPPGGGPKCKWSLPDELTAVLDEMNGVNVDTAEDNPALPLADGAKTAGEKAIELLSDDDIDQLLKPKEDKDG